MADQVSDRPSQSTFPMGVAVAIIGYGDDARAQALALRAGGANVTVAVRHGGMSWVRALGDGFRAVSPGEAVPDAEVVVVAVPSAELPALWGQTIQKALAKGALVVFTKGTAVYAGAIDPGPDTDAVLIARDESGCLVAVHHDATGRALERAAAFARAAHGATRVGTTTFADAMDAELDAQMARAGGYDELLAEWERTLATPGHEPDAATLDYYERLRHAVGAARRSSGVVPSAPHSTRGAA